MAARIARVLAAAALAAPLVAAFATARVEAHATLVKCNIPRNAVLHVAPKLVTCTFAEGVNPKGSFIGVFEATGDGGEDDLGNSQVSFSNAKQMTVGLPKLSKGAYLLIWFTVSADDGHKAGGAFSFTIR
jgi:methionine-rich copper-binding protein CopC